MTKLNLPAGGPKIIVIVGPTASGKSDLAIRMAQKFNGEIISADSRQVYRGMDIGTGKVSKKEQRLVRHHLLDVANPKKIFTVAQFKKLGQRAINDISKRNKLPIIVGGTGQYIDTLIYNFALPEVPPNYKLRAKLSRFASRGARLANRGSSIYYQNYKIILNKSGEKTEVDILFALLQKLDPQRAKNIDAKNPRRLIRAIEIVTATGKPVGPINKQPLYHILWLGLNPKNLNQRITARLSARIKQGMIAEVKKLRANGISWQRLYDFGLEYRWVGEYLQKKITKEKMISGLNRAIRQYSKRQMTWFKRNKETYWLKNKTEAMRLGRDFLKNH